jgi:hypothetical protein
VHETNVCFFCGKQEGKDSLHAASTQNIDTRVRKAATTLRDRALLAKLGTTDLIAQGAQYHARCLIDLYNLEKKAQQVRQIMIQK